MIRAIIFDCFGVFYVDPVIAYMHDPASPPAVATALHNLDEQSARGRITKTQFIEQAAALLNVAPAEIDQRFFQGEVRNQPLVDYAERLRDHYKIGLLSNIGGDMMNGFFSAADRAQLFDEVILSGDVGIAKPDVKIFQLACDRLGILPAEAIMIDDIGANVRGARDAGLAGIVYENFAQFKASLSNLL